MKNKKEKEEEIDFKVYSKQIAMRHSTTLTKFLYYTGALNLYLDYGIWRPVFRKWHPFIWVVFIIHCFRAVWESVLETNHYFSIKKGRTVNWFKNAPDKIKVCGDYVFILLNGNTLEFYEKNTSFFVESVINTRIGKKISIGSFFFIPQLGIVKDVRYIYVTNAHSNPEIFICSNVYDRSTLLHQVENL